MSWRARLSKSLNELRIVYCAHSESSNGTREFIKKNYSDLKALNPGLPIYIRPADGVKPHIAARYDRGVYITRSTDGMNADGVLSEVQKLEASASSINSKISGGIGGSQFKLASII